MKTLKDWQKEFPVGCYVRTPFYNKERDKIRRVKEVFQSPINNHSAAWILTDDGLSCDVAWFTKINNEMI